MNDIVFEHKGLSLERLHLLCDVARMGGIRAAVGDDPVRQSLASRQLKELSAYANTELTKRFGRGIEVTPEGAELVDIGNEFFAKMSAFLQRTHNLPIDFRLGVGDSIFQWQILPNMKQFENQFKSCKLLSFSYSSAEIIKAVESRKLDAGIVRKSAITDTSLIAKPIGEVHYKLFVPTHFCKAPKQNQLPPIAGIPFCTLTGEGEYAKATIRFLSAFNGQPTLNCSSMTQMFAAVQSGQYAAILPENAESGTNKTLTKTFTLPELAAFTRQISLIFKPDIRESEEKSAIIDFLSTCF